MKPLLVAGGVVIGLAAPFFLFALIILGLSLTDVYAQALGVGTE